MNDAGPENSSVHMTGSPAAALAVSPSGSGTDVVSQGSSTRNSSGVSAATGGRQGDGSAGDISLRQKIRAALQANLVYPYIARKKRMEGSVTVSFRINQTGNPEAIRILKGSGYSILDAAARDTVVKASPFPARNNSVEVPITFTLTDH
jgi:protein TonB